MMIPWAKAALLAELRIYWLNFFEGVLSIILTYIWFWGISFTTLRNMKYPFITITPRSTLTLSGGCCYIFFGLNRSVWKLLGLYSRLVIFFWGGGSYKWTGWGKIRQANTIKVTIERIYYWFYWNFNLLRVIWCIEVWESCTLYVYIYTFCEIV